MLNIVVIISQDKRSLHHSGKQNFLKPCLHEDLCVDFIYVPVFSTDSSIGVFCGGYNLILHYLRLDGCLASEHYQLLDFFNFLGI